MNRSGFIVSLASVALLGFAATRAVGYPNYYEAGTNPQSGGCYQCHPSFDGRSTLHGVHVGTTKITATCGLCHTQQGDNPSTLASAVDAGHSCNGCHVGPGLRRRHLVMGAPTDDAGRKCNTCHTSDPAPAGENVAPPYYSRTDVNVHDPCLSDAAAGGEHWDGDLVDLRGLDNDGDMVYDSQDADCRTTGVSGTTPSEFGFAPLYPNPAKSRVMLDLAIPRAVVAKITVYDQAGRSVRTIAHREFAAGRHALEWDTRDDRGNPLPSGIYFVSFRAPDRTTTRTLVFIR